MSHDMHVGYSRYSSKDTDRADWTRYIQRGVVCLEEIRPNHLKNDWPQRERESEKSEFIAHYQKEAGRKLEWD